MNTGNKKLVYGGLVAGGGMLLAAGLVIGAGVAKADGWVGDHDSYAYAIELHQVGMTGTASSAMGLANTICFKRSEGFAESAVIEYAETPPHPIPHRMAVAIVYGAEYHFCPQYQTGASRGGNDADVSYGA